MSGHSNPASPTPLNTEGIKYTGSKLKLIPFISSLISDLKIETVLDGFSGSTRVSQAFAQKGFRTTSNDVAVWSETLATAYLLNTHPASYYQPLIDHLNSLRGYEGWFTQQYGATHLHGVKRPFQLKNTQKLDAIRDEIDKLNLNRIEKAVALTSLVLALDKVDNTLGHYAAYLAKWSARSHNDLQLRVPRLFENTLQHEVCRGDVFDIIQKRTYDLAYFDPPYGSNNEKMPPSRVRYNSYYHIWTSVILNDRPALFGKANRREDSRDEVAASVFEEFRKDENGKYIAMQAIRRLIHQTNARYILLSYSSGGRACRDELQECIHSAGKIIKIVEIDFRKNVMGQLRWTNEWVNSDGKYLEYLFLMEKF